MQRWCEMRADAEGRLLVVFRELVGSDPVGVGYAYYTSPLPIPPVVETSYADRGPFNKGSIVRLRVVS